MCPPKPNIEQVNQTIPDPAPPVEETATEFVRDKGDKSKSGEKKRKGRVSASDLRVDLSVPSGGGGGLQV